MYPQLLVEPLRHRRYSRTIRSSTCFGYDKATIVLPAFYQNCLLYLSREEDTDQFAQGHLAYRWQSQNLNPSSLAPEPTPLTTEDYGLTRTSLVVQWLRLCAPYTGDPRSIPGQGTRSLMPQPRVRMLQLQIPHAATKTQCCQNK